MAKKAKKAKRKKKLFEKKLPLFLWSSCSGTAWFRIANPVMALREEFKWEVAVNPLAPLAEGHAHWEVSLADRHGLDFENTKKILEKMLKRANILVMEAPHTNEGAAVINWVRKTYKIPIIVTIDDYILGLTPDMGAYEVYKIGAPIPKWMVYSMIKADAVITSTEYLKKLYKPFNKNIHVIGNFMNKKEWDLKPKAFPMPRNKKVMRIIWQGGLAHHNNLKLIEEPLIAFLKKYPKETDLMLMGAVAKMKWDELPNVHHHGGCDFTKFAQTLTDIRPDVGIAPLLDTRFMRSKSNLRYLTYSMLGIPTVASVRCNVLEPEISQPYYETIINGAAASEPHRFYELLEYYLKNPDQRKQHGKWAKEYVNKDYNFRECATQYAELLNHIRKNYRIKP